MCSIYKTNEYLLIGFSFTAADVTVLGEKRTQESFYCNNHCHGYTFGNQHLANCGEG